MPVVQNRRTRSSGRRAVRMAAVEAMESRRLLAATIYVDQFAPGALQDGTSWDTAYLNLRDAIIAARSEDSILIAGGTYLPTDGGPLPGGVSNRYLTFSLKSGVGIYGGFAGSADPADPDSRDIDAYETILSGDIGIQGDASDNSFHVVTGSGANATAILDGVTIADGNASNAGSYESVGGGLIVRYGSPTLRDCVFVGNSAVDGAGLFAEWSSLTLIDCIFVANDGAPADNSFGGGANFQYSTATLTGCIFDSNSAAVGGAITAFESTLTLNDCLIAYNTGLIGAGIFVSGAGARLSAADCIFGGNIATNGGAVVAGNGAVVTFDACFFGGNQAAYGGAVFLDAVTPATRLTNCIFAANAGTTSGGGIYLRDSAPTLVNCTFAFNAALGAGDAGGAIFNENSSPTLVNCILWGDLGGEITNSSGFSQPIVTYTDIQGGWAGTGNINLNPRFLRDPNPGDDGVWGTDDDDFGDLRLRPLSPAADAGNNAAVPAGTTTDVVGNERFVDSPYVVDTGSGASPIVDMGAYEAPGIWPVSFDTDEQDVDETDGTATITVELLAPLPHDVTAQLLFGGSAVRGVDYTVPGAVLTIPAGATSATIVIQIIDNNLYEQEKTIVVRLGALNGAVEGDIVEQTIIIFDDSDPPVLDPIADQTVNYTDTLTVQAHAIDPFDPGPSLEYSLDGAVPDGASITPDGLFTWTPLRGEPVGVYTFTIRVSSIDNPALFDVKSFQVRHTILTTTLSGNLFRDFDRNNRIGAGEGPLAGWQVYADLNSNGSLDAGEPAALADVNGHWEIVGVLPGNMRVTTVVPAGWLTTTPVMTSLPFDVPSGRAVSFSPVGFYRALNYTGAVFQDANLNGLLDAGEAGLAGATVWADLNNNGAADPGEPRSTIGADGAFALNNILEGNVVIRAAVPSGWIITNYPNGYTTPIIPDDQQPTPINIAAIQLAPVAGSVFDDVNGNGVREPAERGFAGTTVWLDLNDNGVRDSGEPSATTDAAGQFTIANVPAGTYRLRTSAQAGYVFTTPATGIADVTRTGSLPSLGNNLALRKAVGSISGVAFVDAGSDGVRQASERPMAGLLVFLDADGNGVLNWGEYSTYTSAAGEFSFSNVPIGSYTLGAAVPGGYRSTTETSEVLTVSVGSSTSRDVGLAPFAAVKGRVILDRNRNGRMDAGDRVVARQRVFLDANRNGMFDPGETSVLTNSKGYYSFGSLSAGTYVVRLVPAGEYKLKSPATGAHVAAVMAGQIWNGRNFLVV